jgi:hypothetical protein
MYDLKEAPGGGITDWNVGTESFGGKTYYKATFKFQPYDSYPRAGTTMAQYYLDWIYLKASATCYVNSEKTEIQNGHLYFDQAGTSNGLPASGVGDPTHTTSQLPDCWFGTDTAVNHMKTYTCQITGILGITTCYGEVVPNTMRYQSWLRNKVKEAYGLATPWNDCDDDLCDGQDWNPPGTPGYTNVIGVPVGGAGDGEIHQCLGMAAMIKFDGTEENKKKIPYFDNRHVYALAFKRFVTAVETKFNEDSTLKALVTPTASWYYNKTYVKGGSKRGVFTLGSFTGLEGLNDGNPPTTVNSFAGHCFGDYALRVYDQKKEYFGNQSRACYADAHGMAAYMAGEYGSRRDGFASLVAQTASYLSGRKLVWAGGIQDTYFMPTVTSCYAAGMPDSFRWLHVPNVGHGGGWIDYLEAATCWVANAAFSDDHMKIVADWELIANEVTASVTEVTPDAVELWCSTSQHSNNYPSHCQNNATCNELPSTTRWDPPDLTSAVWTKTTMTYNSQSQKYEGTPATGSGDYATWQACFVRANKLGSCTVTSPVILNENLCTFDPCAELSSS